MSGAVLVLLIECTLAVVCRCSDLVAELQSRPSSTIQAYSPAKEAYSVVSPQPDEGVCMNHNEDARLQQLMVGTIQQTFHNRFFTDRV